MELYGRKGRGRYSNVPYQKQGGRKLLKEQSKGRE